MKIFNQYFKIGKGWTIRWQYDGRTDQTMRFCGYNALQIFGLINGRDRTDDRKIPFY